jgi:hypothetical protein
MSAAVVEHPLVRDYLRRLDAACAALPAAQARELHDQIIAHLDEALPPDAANDEVAAELGRLGSPAALAAELGRLGSPAALAAEAAGPVRPTAAARLRNRLSRLGWRARTLIAVLVVLVVVLIGGSAIYLNSVFGADPLSHEGIAAWWFPQDRTARGSSTTTAGDVTQNSVPERWGQQQGIVVGVYNDSGWTQTIVGPAGAWAVPGALSPVLLAVGSDPVVDEGGAWSAKTHWDRPGSIPPHSYRLLRILWTSRVCNTPDGSTSIQDVTLRVRVGLITRTEDFQLGNAWAITGTSTSSPAVCK